MTALQANKQCCASSKSSLGVFDFFERGLRRRRLAPLTLSPAIATQLNGLWAHFSLSLDADSHGQQIIQELRFDCSACTTLIAACQIMVEVFEGQLLSPVLVQSKEQLLTQLCSCIKGVPAAKHDRIGLALEAFIACLHHQAVLQQQELIS